MKIYTEERVGWMGSDVARYKRHKRAVSQGTMPGCARGVCHPQLCHGDDHERLIIVHLREADVVRSRRLALLKLAWLFMRDALTSRLAFLSHATKPPAIKQPAVKRVAFDPETVDITINRTDSSKPTGPAVQPGGSL